MSKLTLELNAPYSLNMGEDMEFIGVYQKGKSKALKVEDIRPLFRGVKTGKEYLLINSVRDRGFLGVELNFEDGFKTLIPGSHLKLKSYNYYFSNTDPSQVERVLEEWKNSNPLIHVGSFQHMKMNTAPGYTYAYKFNSKTY